MREIMFSKKFGKKAVFTTILGMSLAGAANASLVSGADLINNVDVESYISAGNGDNSMSRADALDTRTDANTLNSRFTGVVSLAVVIEGTGYICTGTAITQKHILTAAHCIDSNDRGQVLDISDPNNSVSVIFNHDGDSSAIINAKSVAMHHDYEGFNICPDGSLGCAHDDVAIIELESNVPAGVEIYELYQDTIYDTLNLSFFGGGDGDLLTLVGYGTRGDGYSGYYTNDGDTANGFANFNEKLVGANIVDMIDTDDEGQNVAEVWYADFDGTYDDGQTQTDIDYLCGFTPRLCSTVLSDDLETAIGGGDSGGPSFIYDAFNDKFLLAGINTFGGNTSPIAHGAFGHLFGGIILDPYRQWIANNTVVPTPATLGLFAIALGGLAMRRRKTA